MKSPKWVAAFMVHSESPEAAERLLRSLTPEAAREVPKTSATLTQPTPSTVRIEVRASDSGALRAASNTYLGWIDLASAAEAVAHAAGPPTGGRPPKPLSR